METKQHEEILKQYSHLEPEAINAIDTILQKWKENNSINLKHIKTLEEKIETINEENSKIINVLKTEIEENEKLGKEPLESEEENLKTIKKLKKTIKTLMEHKETSEKKLEEVSHLTKQIEDEKKSFETIISQAYFKVPDDNLYIHKTKGIRMSMNSSKEELLKYANIK